ncbi:MAG: 6,7-dimethyl-8-ribityllumazine synthase [Patescibacteria group bacterium]
MQKAQQAELTPFDASEWQLGVVVAQFNNHITDQLYQSAIRRAADYKLSPEAIKTVKVAGSVEMPLVLQHLAKTGRFQALLAIGCVIKGDTPHFDYVCSFVTSGILRVQLDHNMPIGFGVLTCETEAQALERAQLGGEHLDAVLQQAKVLHELK